MPQWLHHPLMQGAISAAEASELWDQWLLEGSPFPFCPESQRLQDVAMRIRLLYCLLPRMD